MTMSGNSLAYQRIILVSSLLFSLFSSCYAAVKVNSSELYLSSDFKITSTAQTRNYRWTLTNETAAPDGYTRNMLVINSHRDDFELRADRTSKNASVLALQEGDTINIVVTNTLNGSVSIHWHGLHQNGTGWMDGVTGVTQCPIPAGSTFTYTFTVSGQYGTFWYHAHSQNYAADGVAGPLIIHSVDDPLVRGVDYDQDVILFMNDWYHNLSALILSEQLSPEGYLGSVAAPLRSFFLDLNHFKISSLINGIGYFDCTNADPGSTCTTPTKYLTFDLHAGRKTRLRLIEGGSHALFRVSVDQHTLNVTEADATGVAGPTAVHRVPFHNGERYSVILDLSKDTIGSTFYLRAAMDTDCFAWLAPGMDGQAATARAIIRVVDPAATTYNTTVTTPNSTDWSDSVSGDCLDLDPDTLVPLVPEDACTNVLGRLYYESSFGFTTTTENSTTVSLGRFFVNDTTWLTYVYQPLLSEMTSGGRGFLNTSEVAAFTMETNGCYDIVINNLDAAINHPYHLHGVDAKTVATGTGELNDTVAATLTYNTTNPLRRDASFEGSEHRNPRPRWNVPIRIVADNPGVWILHCHIGWHLGAGFAGVFVMNPAAVSQFTIPAANQALCDGATAATIDEIEPGRRKRSLQSAYQF
ncbi:multi-copper oxidase laccase-like protein [Melampsora larici-populina 98AG31]|uniref:Multi-copper oxidase laccase-like protein n=1 Tax=Melampsora larici-populina (strain 98AG31 / pathotype 3-4-7) TaxID=747676 RepID=F4R9G7_MELLP|nr:multi-copper oxidase laccase-like protein [Melampsora larici-populina 98AG31]EGG10979.1 multi-copper oxidase laccase-like protein [Melampsora larici-populina 98AG31]